MVSPCGRQYGDIPGAGQQTGDEMVKVEGFR